MVTDGILGAIQMIIDRFETPEEVNAGENIFNMLGTIENGQVFVINNVRVRVAFNFILEDNMYNLPLTI